MGSGDFTRGYIGPGALREGPWGPRFQRLVGLLGCARQGPYAGPLVGEGLQHEAVSVREALVIAFGQGSTTP